jgi:hypothetical protein
MLNALVARTSGEIIVFADVRQTFDAAALRALIQPFADAAVGAVTGELKLRGSEEAPGLYWRYEKFIRSQECLIDSTMVVTGAMYAIRRSLFEPIASDTICDDLLIPMRITRRGVRRHAAPGSGVHAQSAHAGRCISILRAAAVGVQRAAEQAVVADDVAQGVAPVDCAAANHRVGDKRTTRVFCLLSAATVIGFFRWITRRQPVTWRKAAA